MSRGEAPNGFNLTDPIPFQPVDPEASKHQLSFAQRWQLRLLSLPESMDYWAEAYQRLDEAESPPVVTIDSKVADIMEQTGGELPPALVNDLAEILKSRQDRSGEIQAIIESVVQEALTDPEAEAQELHERAQGIDLEASLPPQELDALMQRSTLLFGPDYTEDYLKTRVVLFQELEPEDPALLKGLSAFISDDLFGLESPGVS